MEMETVVLAEFGGRPGQGVKEKVILSKEMSLNGRRESGGLSFE